MDWPTPYDLGTGIVLGVAPAESTGGAVRAPVGPLAALEAAVLPALRRPPCAVSFSGGLDSSVVLAVAARVARREGLPDPVPVTWRFVGAPKAEESSWQDEVVRALDLGAGWQRLTADDDLDLVGPVAGEFLHRYGLRHPLNLHLHLPLIALAAGGSLLTGVGGDQILAGWHRPRSGSFAGRLRQRYGRARAILRRRRATEVFPWLRPDAARAFLRAYEAERRTEPERLDRRIDWHLRRRDLRLNLANFAEVGADHDVTVGHPLLAPGFLDALVAAHGHRQRPGRDELLAAVLGDALPPVVTAPRRKAHFLEVYLRTPTREFTRGWDGRGLDTDIVDPVALRAAWSRWPIPECTAALVQQLWLQQNPPPAQGAAGSTVVEVSS
ncbi:asparagine synthase-related protein [Micromonospora sp. NPDC000089]|uniref:asparagine synthase-related protein n=1 Tax=unclassified Micromonospora TaxID=2617518 RepID=UPI0036B342F7